MEPIPPDIISRFNDALKQHNIPMFSRHEYRKWLRYFLDFRAKYPVPPERSVQIKLFSDKLRSKGQTPAQVEQAADAVSLFYSSQRIQPADCPPPPAGVVSAAAVRFSVEKSHRQITASYLGQSKKENELVCEPPDPPTPVAYASWRGRRFDEWRCLRKSGSAAWDRIITGLAEEIRTRHYSRKTLQHYANWTRKYQSYLSNKEPTQLSSEDVKCYLTYLAVNCKVSSSTQNQAFNALLFLYRHVLKKDFGNHKDIPRAKKSTYVPTVLTRDEIQEVLNRMRQPYQLIAKLQYGCGLRLFEGIKLRVQDSNFDEGVLTLQR